MPKRKTVFTQTYVNSKRRKLARRNETEEEREGTLTKLRERMQRIRDGRSEQERAKDSEATRLRVSSLRNRESDNQRQIRNAQNRDRMANIRHDIRRNYNLHLEGLHYDATKKYSEHPNIVIGKMIKTCKYCSAKKFKGETPGMCCMSGKVKLPPLKVPPPQLYSYMIGTAPDSKHFLQNIRRYNSCFQMTSFGATSVCNDDNFAPVFKIQGQVYHRLGSLIPPLNETPKFLQLYFVGDEQQELDQRCTHIQGLQRPIVQELQSLLHTHNQLINVFKTSLQQMVADNYRIVIRADKRPAGEHERRYNTPQVNEVAVVIVDNEYSHRDIIIQRRSNELQRIAETHRSYDALQYPLIFWQGEDGYHFNIHQVNLTTGAETNKKVSSMQFYAYRLMIREGEYNHILNCRKLFQQFIVDMYAKIETERLDFIRHNQRKLRSDEYIHLRDAMMNDGNVDNVGKLVILPSTFTGSPRHLHEYAQDAMTYVRKHGRPDLFITFTCNSSWHEIKDELQYGQAANDRHDIIARVFRQKQIKFVEAIVKLQIFGAVTCWMYSIEWQKRGLPHSHTLIWLQEKLKPYQIDTIIRAEFPNPEEDPELFEIIKKHMIHGPCGAFNRSSPCMKHDNCTKHYPKPFLFETQTGEDGYPKYRRRSKEQGGFTAVIKIRGHDEIEVGNQWVVPYNPLLSKMFSAHINVEYCSSVKSIKYVCKYINKGSDMAVFTLTKENKHNEILQYQMGRYINTNEAIWRILGFPIHDRDPPVIHLSVHLENGQRIYFTRETLETVATGPPARTTLTAFFELCQDDPFARTLLYSEVPSFYTWDTSTKKFRPRKRGVPLHGHDGVYKTNTIGRVYTVHPKNAECFYLRLLLHTIRGPTSFAHLRTVNGSICETYREACQRLGLLENDNHWDLAMNEAVQTATANQIRELFAIILTTCNPSDPNRLWLKYRESMSDDVLAELRRDNPELRLDFNEEIFNNALLLLEDKCLAMTNQTLLQLGVQLVPRRHFDAGNREILREKSYDTDDLRSYVQHNKPLLNQSQKDAYDTIMKYYHNHNGGIIFLDAPGGTGKTFLINLLLAEIRATKEIVLALASSGIAATLMDGGRTAHSALKLPLNVADHVLPICDITKSSPRAQLLKECKAIIWDECTMAHRKCLEALNRTLQDIRDNTSLMGGILLILSGDFRQTLPVIPKSTPADEINACIKKSFIWQYVKVLRLATNMRAQISGDERAQEFGRNLLRIGEGTYPTDSDSDHIIVTNELCNNVQNPELLITQIYPDIVNNYTNSDWLCERIILAPKNEIVNDINKTVQQLIPGPETSYMSIDTVTDDNDSVHFPTEFLNSLIIPGMPLHCLKLKVGSPVILLRNLNSPKLCNGTRLCITQLHSNIIGANIMTGKQKGQTVFIPRIPLLSSGLPFTLRRLQFPVKLAYSMTINKAQGQTFKYCGVNLTESCFSHGQLYVACSRVGSPTHLFLYTPNKKTANIVYKQVL